jgi:hypothetical protein
MILREKPPDNSKFTQKINKVWQKITENQTWVNIELRLSM